MLVVVGAVDASTRGRNKRQHRSRPRLASVDNPWFKEFCAYDGGRDDVRRRETRTRRERAHRGQCEQRQRLARTRRQDLGEDAKRGASSDGRDTRREHTRTMTKLTRCEISHLKQGVRKTFSHAFRSFFSWETNQPSAHRALAWGRRLLGRPWAHLSRSRLGLIGAECWRSGAIHVD